MCTPNEKYDPEHEKYFEGGCPEICSCKGKSPVKTATEIALEKRRGEDNTQWEERFDKRYELFDPTKPIFFIKGDNAKRIIAAPEDIKQFIRQEREKARQEERVKLSDKMFDVANKYNDCADKLLDAKQQTAREIVEMIDLKKMVFLDKDSKRLSYEKAARNKALNDLTDQIKKDYGIK